MQAFSPRPLVDCPVCKSPLQTLGRLPIRKDAAQSQIFLPATPGDPAPAVGLDVYRCGNCGRLEFYDHDFQLPAH